jgi:hypothetical protein
MINEVHKKIKMLSNPECTTQMVNDMASQTTSASIFLKTVVCEGFYIETALCESIATLSEISSLWSSLSKELPRVQR